MSYHQNADHRVCLCGPYMQVPKHCGKRTSSSSSQFDFTLNTVKGSVITQGRALVSSCIDTVWMTGRLPSTMQVSPQGYLAGGVKVSTLFWGHSAISPSPLGHSDCCPTRTSAKQQVSKETNAQRLQSCLSLVPWKTRRLHNTVQWCHHHSTSSETPTLSILLKHVTALPHKAIHYRRWYAMYVLRNLYRSHWYMADDWQNT